MVRPHLRLAIRAGLLLAVLAGGALHAQPFPPAPPDERGEVGDWRVDHAAEEDGGRIVRMTRIGGGLAIAYHVAFWRGNGGPLSGLSVERRGQSCASRSWRREPDGDVWRPEADLEAASRDVRARIADALAECGLGPRRTEAALAGFERAFALASIWSEAARLATLAEADAIANYGREAEAAPEAPAPAAPRPEGERSR